MSFPDFNKKPAQIIHTPYRDIYLFEKSTDNIDKETVDSFGNEWNSFHGFTEEEIRSLGENYFDITDESMISRSMSVLEVGCGSGRFLRYLSDKAGLLVGADPGDAIFAADKLVADLPNVMLIQAAASDLPFPDDSFDFVYSIGVLHHIPDTAKAMKSCVSKLKKNGYFLTYIYYNLDNRGLFFRMAFRLVNGVRALVSKLSPKSKKITCDVLAIIFYMPFILFSRFLRWLGVNKKVRNKIPLHFYEDKSFYIIRNDSLDRFGTPLEQRFSRTEIEAMMKNAGLSQITFSERMPYWHAVGKKTGV